MTLPQTLTSLDMALLAIESIHDKKGFDPIIVDVRQHSTITDYYLLVSGHNGPHLKALFTESRQRLKAAGTHCYRQSGTSDSGWIVADYVDIIIHFFTTETRAYYALDELWKDAPRVPVAAVTELKTVIALKKKKKSTGTGRGIGARSSVIGEE